jgi:hypothetical protein
MDNKCDFCREREIKGVYATDHGPFSLGYCGDCLKKPNIRTLANGLSKWARFGDKAYDEHKLMNGGEPNVYFKGEYMLLRDLIDIITIEDVDEYFGNRNDWLTQLIKEKIQR